MCRLDRVISKEQPGSERHRIHSCPSGFLHLGRVLAMTILIAVGVSLGSPSAKAQASIGVTVKHGILVVAGTNQQFIPRGFTSEGLTYPKPYATALCSLRFQRSANARYLKDAQAALNSPPLPGLGYNASFQAMVHKWHANTVRFLVSQGGLQYGYAHGLSKYADTIRSVVAKARAAGLIVIIAMKTGGYSCTPYEHGQMQKLPDQRTEQAWSHLLDNSITYDRGVILEVFNEPATSKACHLGTFMHPVWEKAWPDWAKGCGTEPRQGMLVVGKYLRKIAPGNVLLFDGDGPDFAFTQFRIPRGLPNNSAFTFHPYGYIVNGSKRDSVSAWNKRFGHFAQKGHAIFVTEWNEAFSCPHDPNQSITRFFIQSYLPAHSIGMIGYGWDAPVEAKGHLVNSYSYTGNNANYQLVDPNQSGCDYDGGKLLLQQFRAEAAKLTTSMSGR